MQKQASVGAGIVISVMRCYTRSLSSELQCRVTEPYRPGFVRVEMGDGRWEPHRVVWTVLDGEWEVSVSLEIRDEYIN